MRRDNLSGTKYPINNVDDDDHYVLQNEQLLTFIQIDEVVPVVNPEEVGCQFYLLRRSAIPLLMDGVCFDRVCSLSLNSFD